MTEIVNLTRVRKKRRAAGKETYADENRAKFGRTKAERAREQAEKTRAAKTLEGAKRDD